MPGLNLTAVWSFMGSAPGFVIDNWQFWVSLVLAIIGIWLAWRLGKGTDQNVNANCEKINENVNEKHEELIKKMECIINHQTQNQPVYSYLNGDPSSSDKILEEVKPLLNATSSYEIGLFKAVSGDLKGAESEFDAAIGNNLPILSKCYFQRGNARYLQKNYEGGHEDYSKTVMLDPKFVGAWNNKGNSLSHLGRHEEALEAFDKAIELDPKHAKAWYNKGIALDCLDRYEEAIIAYDNAIKLDPKHAEAWYNKGIALVDLGRHEEALEAFDKAIELDPELAAAWNYKGKSLADLGRHEEALEAFDKAIELDPELAAAWFNKSSSLTALDRYSEAMDAFSMVIELEPKLFDPSIPLENT